MAVWVKVLSNMCPHFIPYELIRKKYQSEQMFPTTLLVVVFLCGVGLAYFTVYVPSILLSLFPNKQISRAVPSHDTSVILRVRQQQFPPNPGKLSTRLNDPCFIVVACTGKQPIIAADHKFSVNINISFMFLFVPLKRT